MILCFSKWPTDKQYVSITFKIYFNPTKKTTRKAKKKLSINLLVVSINNILDSKVEKDEIIIAIPSHLPKTFKMKRSVGKSEHLSTWIYKSSTIYWKKVSCMKMLLSLMPTNAIIPSLWKILKSIALVDTLQQHFLISSLHFWEIWSSDEYQQFKIFILLPLPSGTWVQRNTDDFFDDLFFFVSKFCTHNSMILFKIILP